MVTDPFTDKMDAEVILTISTIINLNGTETVRVNEP